MDADEERPPLLRPWIWWALIGTILLILNSLKLRDGGRVAREQTARIEAMHRGQPPRPPVDSR
jgi:hypothetical protein